MIKDTYNASRIDWERLRKYALRVAKETRLALSAPITYEKTVRQEFSTEKTSGGLFGIGAKTITVVENRDVLMPIRVLGNHWKLDYRHWHLEDNYKTGGVRVQETTHEYHTLGLMPDGSIFKGCVMETEVLNFGGARSGLVYLNKEHIVRPIDDQDVLDLDFEKKYRETGRHNVNKKMWGDRDPGPRLLRHAKGVGLNLALKGVLEGKPLG